MAEQLGRLLADVIARIMQKLGFQGKETDRQSTDEEDTMTSQEPRIPLKIGGYIVWKEGDEIIKKMQAERKGEEIPSFWNYDPRCLPKEFVGLEKKTFLDDTSAVNICFLDKDILRKISKMLDPMDFLNLSYTCRFLHWRLFTFCTCYAPYFVSIQICDQTMGYYENCGETERRLFDSAPNKTIYSLSLEENGRRSRYLAREEGLRAIVARIPSCLRNPFYFDRLSVCLNMPFFTKKDFDRCLAFIQPLRKYARDLSVYMYYYNRTGTEKFFDYQAANDFFQTLNVTSYYACDMKSFSSHPDRTLKMFENCPYVRLMDTVKLCLRDTGSKYEDTVFLNRVGEYYDPPVSAILQTIKEFCYGTGNLDYHEYELQDIGKQIAFMEYFFANYLDYEEYCHEYAVHLWGGRYRVSTRVEQSKVVRFVTVMTEETGRKHMMRVSVESQFDDQWTHVTFGTEKAFTKERSFQDALETCRAGKYWWRMETAIEPKEGNEDEEESGAGGGTY